MLGLLERIAGVGFLDDLTEFLRAIDGLSKGFRERATRVEEVLLGEETGFVLISSAGGRSQAATLEFMGELEKFRVPLVALIVNRVGPWPVDTTPDAVRKRCTPGALADDETCLTNAFAQNPASSTVSEDARAESREVIDAVLAYVEICAAEQASVAALEAIAGDSGLRCHTVPELSGDIDRIDGLLDIGAILRSNPTRTIHIDDRVDPADAAQENMQ